MLKLLTVIGARPQIIKAAAISRAIKNRFSQAVEEKILHTGQHYDANMSQVFFDELGIPQPHFNLGVGSGRHGEQTAKMISGIEEVLLSEPFDGVILYGDTNSTLAGAVAAAKLHVPVFHIEAGLRSFNMSMPEEQNRIVCDQLSSICFAPTQTAVENLRREGFMESRAQFPNGQGRRVCNCGDVMYDNSLHFAAVAEQRCTILHDLGLQPEGYILATIHRDNNTDDPARLSAILQALTDIQSQSGLPIILPLHPRTKAKLSSSKLQAPSYVTSFHDSSALQPRKQAFGHSVSNCSKLNLINPASFLEMTLLERNAHLVMTDSGGVQKESFFFERPCVILRPETEWVEIVDHGAGIIADADHARIVEAYNKLSGQTIHFPRLFGDGHAAEKMIECILQYNG